VSFLEITTIATSKTLAAKAPPVAPSAIVSCTEMVHRVTHADKDEIPDQCHSATWITSFP
jgi:hypothetical protein